MELAHALATSAERYSKRALTAFVNEDDAEFFLCAGIAIEHAMKARLARESPVFVAPDGNFAAAVALLKFSGSVESLPTGTNTVGAKAAVARVEQLDRAFQVHAAGVRDLLQYRNGEAHLGVVDATKRRAAAVVFFRSINALLRWKPKKFWSPHEHMVKALLDEDAEALRQTVEIKLSAARIKLDGLKVSEHFDAITASAELNAEAHLSETSLVVLCPVCGLEVAVASGENQEVFDATGDEWTSEMQLWVSSFKCMLCGLSLDSAEEVDQAGAPGVIQNPEVPLLAEESESAE